MRSPGRSARSTGGPSRRPAGAASATAPSSSRRSSVAPMMRAWPRQIARPRPVPPPRSGRASANRSPACGRNWPKPSPWSRTSISASSPSAATRTLHRRPAVAAGVVEQVRDDALDAPRVAQHVQLGRRVDLGAGQPQVHDVAHQPRQVERVEPRHLARLEAHHLEQVLDQRRQRRGALAHHAGGARVVEQRRRGDEAGDRRAQLVRDVAREPLLALGRLVQLAELARQAPRPSRPARGRAARSRRGRVGLRRASRSPAASRRASDHLASQAPAEQQRHGEARAWRRAARRRCRPGRARRAGRRGRSRRPRNEPLA